MVDTIEIIDTNADNILDYGVCGYKSMKRAGYPEKIEWLKTRFSEGMKIKTLYAREGGTQGMIEYIPGEYCWRPVDAGGYMFIHCVFVGFKRQYKEKGYATRLISECLDDARKENMHGVAATTRKGAFMAGKELFIKNGFTVVDSAPPDFELLAIHYWCNFSIVILPVACALGIPFFIYAVLRPLLPNRVIRILKPESIQHDILVPVPVQVSCFHPFMVVNRDGFLIPGPSFVEIEV